VWSTRFLHTYCHMTQMSPAVGDVNFWVSGDTFPRFPISTAISSSWSRKRPTGRKPTSLRVGDPLVDSDEAFIDHYRWAAYQHRLKRRRRFTLKADPDRSFQPQDSDKRLLDVVPFLEKQRLPLESLRTGLRAGITSKPMRLDGSIVGSLYQWVNEQAPVKLTGETLQAIRRVNPQLASPRC